MERGWVGGWVVVLSGVFAPILSPPGLGHQSFHRRCAAANRAMHPRATKARALVGGAVREVNLYTERDRDLAEAVIFFLYRSDYGSGTFSEAWKVSMFKCDDRRAAGC